MSMKAIENAIEWARNDGENQSDLARAIGVLPQDITNWKRRGMPSEWWGRVADHFHRSVDDLIGRTSRTTGEQAPADPALDEPSNVEPGEMPVPKRRLVAVVGHARLGENGWYDEVPAGTDGYVEAISSDPDAYALRVRGDSMYPAIRDGWYVVAEPNHKPTAGTYAAIQLADGRKMVKEFLYETNGSVVLESVNGGKRLTLPASDITAIHPIGNLVMPNKFRGK